MGFRVLGVRAAGGVQGSLDRKLEQLTTVRVNALFAVGACVFLAVAAGAGGVFFVAAEEVVLFLLLVWGVVLFVEHLPRPLPHQQQKNKRSLQQQQTKTISPGSNSKHTPTATKARCG